MKAFMFVILFCIGIAFIFTSQVMLGAVLSVVSIIGLSVCLSKNKSRTGHSSKGKGSNTFLFGATSSSSSSSDGGSCGGGDGGGC